MKKISSISVFVSTVALAGLCGCASNSNQSSTAPAQTTASTTTTAQTPPPPPPKPKKDKRPIEQRLVVGMTMDQVKMACGNPRNESMNSDGSAVWEYASGSPTYNPFTGWGGKMHYVTIVFDASSKVKSWSSNTSENNPSPF